MEKKEFSNYLTMAFPQEVLNWIDLLFNGAERIRKKTGNL
jgi:hypothetical protein